MHQKVIVSAKTKLKAAERGIGSNLAGRIVCVATLVRHGLGSAATKRCPDSCSQLFSISALVFGRDVVPILLGTFGALLSLEGFHGVHRRDPRVVRRVRPLSRLRSEAACSPNARAPRSSGLVLVSTVC